MHSSYVMRAQSIVALSSCEAEYVALATATQEAKFLRQLLADLMCHPCKNVCIICSDQGASKHIDVKYHFVRLEIQQLMKASCEIENFLMFCASNMHHPERNLQKLAYHFNPQTPCVYFQHGAPLASFIERS